MPIPRYLLLDLDNTMYPKSSGLDEAMRERIILFLVQRHGLNDAEARKARLRYIEEFGLSLPGIMRDFNVDVADYQEFIHDLEVSNYVKPNVKLRDFLAGLKLDKAIFTNSSRDHVIKVLDALDISSDLFNHIVDYRGTGCLSKPQPEAFRAMLSIIGAQGCECIMVDDLPKTICVAKNEFGMRCALVDEDGTEGCEEADWRIRSINELPDLISAMN